MRAPERVGNKPRPSHDALDTKLSNMTKHKSKDLYPRMTTRLAQLMVVQLEIILILLLLQFNKKGPHNKIPYFLSNFIAIISVSGSLPRIQGESRAPGDILYEQGQLPTRSETIQLLLSKSWWSLTKKNCVWLLIAIRSRSMTQESMLLTSALAAKVRIVGIHNHLQDLRLDWQRALP